MTSVSVGRPLFIPFLRITRDTPETAGSSIHGALRAMARPGLEPGTPPLRQMYADPESARSSCSQLGFACGAAEAQSPQVHEMVGDVGHIAAHGPLMGGVQRGS